MLTKKLTGPGAGSAKYDVITALGAAGLHGDAVAANTALRLITLLTARYNWRLDEVAIGQTQLARLWGVSPRTVIREMKRLQALELLVVKVPPARGRVAKYRLDLQAVRRWTSSHWEEVGPDFQARMPDTLPAPPSAIVHVDFRKERAPPSDEGDASPWQAVLDGLAVTSPDLHANWFSKLRLEAVVKGEAQIVAPSVFIARHVRTHLSNQLITALAGQYGDVERLSFRIAAP